MELDVTNTLQHYLEAHSVRTSMLKAWPEEEQL